MFRHIWHWQVAQGSFERILQSFSLLLYTVPISISSIVLDSILLLTSWSWPSSMLENWFFPQRWQAECRGSGIGMLDSKIVSRSIALLDCSACRPVQLRRSDS